MAAGGATGGIIGTLTEAGVSKDEAHVYAEGIRRGGTLVTARVPDVERERYAAIMNSAAINIDERASAYRKEGWAGFDETAVPYPAEPTRRERETIATL